MVLGKTEGRARMAIGSGPEGLKTVDLTSKGRGRLVRASHPAVGAVTGAASGVEVILLLEVMAG